VLDAGGAANAVRVIGVDDWRFEDVELTGGVNQGAWVESARRIAFAGVSASRNPGAGIQLKHAVDTLVEGSRLEANGSAGVMETAGTTGTRVVGNLIAGNGHGAAPYNGDGIQLGGTGAVITGNTITGNGQPGLHEHGVYAAAVATGWSIAGNAISGSGAANVKASGSGSVRGNRLVDGTYGLVLAGNTDTVDVAGNVITGRARHLVLALAGARGRLVHNTIRTTAGTIDDSSAVHFKAFDAIEFRNNLACYDGADNLGVALWLGSGGTFTGDTNWLCSRDVLGRHAGSGGARRDASGWRSATGTDARSVFTAPPVFDADARPVGAAVAAGIGDPLADVLVDLAGVAWPASGGRDVGAYRFAVGGDGVVPGGDGGGEGGGVPGGDGGAQLPGEGAPGPGEGGAPPGGGAAPGGGALPGGGAAPGGGVDPGGGAVPGAGAKSDGVKPGSAGAAARRPLRVRLRGRAARRALARGWVRVPRRSFRDGAVVVRVGARVAVRRKLATARAARVRLPRWSRGARASVAVLVRPR
jgi:hypothetical protein